MKRLIVIALVFGGMTAQPPLWFSQPGLNPSKLSGFGVGKNLQAAKQNAILDLANSLQSSVKSSFKQETAMEDDTISSSASEKMTLDTKGIDLAGVDVKKSECRDGQCYVHVEISKSAFLVQLEQKIQSAKQEFARLDSPFDYEYKKNVLLPKLLMNYDLYMALGGRSIEIPNDAGEKPAFDFRFDYQIGSDGYQYFAPVFGKILKNEVQTSIAKIGKISSDAKWLIIITAMPEGKVVTLSIEVVHNDELIYSTSVYETQAQGMSAQFFAKRLATLTSKAMQKLGKH